MDGTTQYVKCVYLTSFYNNNVYKNIRLRIRLRKCKRNTNKFEELEDLLDQLEDDIKETNEIKELIEAKTFFSKIMTLSKESKMSLENKDTLENKLQLARKFLLDKKK